MRTTIEEKIENISLLFFSKQGYHETSTAEIARKAGVSEASIFRLFKTKKDLYIHVLTKFGQIAKLDTPSLYASLSFRDLKKDLVTIAASIYEFYFSNIHLTRIYLSNALQINELTGFEYLIYPEIREFVMKYLEEMCTRDYLDRSTVNQMGEYYLSLILQDVIASTTFDKVMSLSEEDLQEYRDLWSKRAGTLLNMFEKSDLEDSNND